MNVDQIKTIIALQIGTMLLVLIGLLTFLAATRPSEVNMNVTQLRLEVTDLRVEVAEMKSELKTMKQGDRPKE